MVNRDGAVAATNVAFRGNTEHLRRLAFKTTLLTLLTLGIYRFWARTRLRKYFWSSVAPDEQPFEYDGKGLEKLIGFLIAVAILAVYLGILQVLLTYVGLSLFVPIENEDSSVTTYGLSEIAFLAVLPLIYYAQYRARRYKLSRTRWRGIRFGMEKAAWRYSWRAMLLSALTLVSVGILWPLQTFLLEKFKTDRTWFGDVRFEQHGKWTKLYPCMKHMLFGLLVMLGSGLYLAGAGASSNLTKTLVENALDASRITGDIKLAWFGVFLGVIWLYLGVAYYRVASFRYLTAHKTLGQTVTFTSHPKTRRIILIYIFGFVAAFLIAVILGVFVGAVFWGGGVAAFGKTQEALLIGMVPGFLVYFVLLSVCALVFVSQPVIEHFASVTYIHNAPALDDVLQRDGDDFAEAEGFADALDIGGGF